MEGVAGKDPHSWVMPLEILRRIIMRKFGRGSGCERILELSHDLRDTTTPMGDTILGNLYPLNGRSSKWISPNDHLINWTPNPAQLLPPSEFNRLDPYFETN